MAHDAPEHLDEPLTIEPRVADRLFGVGLAVAVAGLVLALVTCWFFGGVRRLMLSYLTAYVFVLTIALGALGFVLLQHATKAGWSVNVRRVPELLARMLFPMLAVMGLPVLVTLIIPDVGGDHAPTLYPWALIGFEGEHGGGHGGGHDDDHGEEHVLPGDAASGTEPGVEALDGVAGDGVGPITTGPNDSDNDAHVLTENGITVGRAEHHLHVDEITESKAPYLNRPFFLLRYLVYFGVWWGLSSFYWRRSVRQDATGDPSLTAEMTWWSYLGILVYFVTLTFAAFDLVMSLDPHFFSTIFGVYLFAGGVVGFFSVTILAYQFLRMGGLLRASVTVEHYHDLGKFLFAFVFFWGYIAFSQFMLIWYANIPETTYWFGLRGASTVPENRYFGAWPDDPNAPAGFGWWNLVILSLLFGHLLVPFALLLSRHVKRNLTALGFMAGWMLTMHYVDVYWLIMPEMLVGGWQLLPVVEASCLLLVGGASLAWFARELKAVQLRPARDPRAVESLAFHNI